LVTAIGIEVWKKSQEIQYQPFSRFMPERRDKQGKAGRQSYQGAKGFTASSASIIWAPLNLKQLRIN